MSTSGAGHLFRLWDARDQRVMREGPFESRLRERTEASCLENVAAEWRDELAAADTYGVREEEWRAAVEA